jgi:hypothetical protein
MRRLLHQEFLTIAQAAEGLSTAMSGGTPDRAIVTQLRNTGFDVGDGTALDDAIEALWAAVDSGSVQAYAIGPTGKGPLIVPAELSRAVPVLRSPRGGALSFLRPGNPNFKAFAEWFGCDLSNVSIVFREVEIMQLARNRLRARRRKQSTFGKHRSGRPSLQVGVKAVIREVVDRKKWSATESIKALTREVNRLGTWIKPVSDETVQRALESLHMETKDRRFERLARRVSRPKAAA